MPTIAQALETAVRLHDSGQLAEAERQYREILKADPRQARAWHNLGLIAQSCGNLDQARDLMTQAIRLDGGQPSFHNNLGTVLQTQGELELAKDCYQRALTLQGAYADAHCNLGSVLKDQGRAGEAIECYRRALAHNPNLHQAHFNLGVVYQSQREWVKATECYENALRIRPDYPEVYNNLGAIHKRHDDLDRAMACYSKALELKPDFAEPLNNLGNIFQTQGRTDEALVRYERSLRINPRYPQAHYNWAALQLAQGNFAAGWPEYEWRLQCPDFPRLALDKPRWQGEPLEGRVLLVVAEQGLGDTLQFIRYVPQLEQRVGAPLVAVQKALVPLLAQSGFRNLVAKGDPSVEYDVYIPLLSLPGLFQTTLDTIPAAIPYLSADPRRVEHWRGELGPARGLRVGIAWQGSPTYGGDRFRSIPLAQFAPLAQEGVELVSLQKGPGTEQLADIAGMFPVRELGAEFDSEGGAFMDTAAVMKCLDLVITSDSAVAHVAAALGVPTWVALSFSPDWRWLLERGDSPWYPTMRLFRQTAFDRWPELFARMADALRQAASQDRATGGE